MSMRLTAVSSGHRRRVAVSIVPYGDAGTAPSSLRPFATCRAAARRAAHAGPCSNAIAQFEQAVRQSANDPNAGPYARQSTGAQLDRQPTPDS